MSPARRWPTGWPRPAISLSARKIVKDDIRAIRHVIRDWTNRTDIDAMITTGGTGLTGHDVTIEAVRPLFEKEIEGFGTLFHMVSFPKIGTSTIQSRATAGVMKGKYIFCLPGSPGACKDGWDHDPEAAARLHPQAVQLRRDHAAAARSTCSAARA